MSGLEMSLRGVFSVHVYGFFFLALFERGVGGVIAFLLWHSVRTFFRAYI